jgi:hypothetical protein
MILDILTVLFFVLGFALVLWMVGERRRDILHGPYLTRPRMLRENARASKLKEAASQPIAGMPSADDIDEQLTRIVREIEEETNLSEGLKAKGK